MKKGRKQMKSEHDRMIQQSAAKKVSLVKNKTSLFLIAVFLIGLIIIFFEIRIYRGTFISGWIPVLSCVITGLFITFFTRRFLERNIGIQSFFVQCIFNTVAWSSILLCSLMALNYYLPQPALKIYRVPILTKSTTGSGRHEKPVVTILHTNKEKELVLKHSQLGQINAADSLVLTTSDGRLGFEIIRGVMEQ